MCSTYTGSTHMGAYHGGGQQGDKYPRIWSGDAVPPRFCHIGTTRSVLWPSKYPKIRFRWGSAPDPAGQLTTLPRPPSRLERGHPSLHSTSLDTDPPSALAMRPPRIPARFTPMVVPTVGAASMFLRPSYAICEY